MGGRELGRQNPEGPEVKPGMCVSATCPPEVGQNCRGRAGSPRWAGPGSFYVCQDGGFDLKPRRRPKEEAQGEAGNTPSQHPREMEKRLSQGLGQKVPNPTLDPGNREAAPSECPGVAWTGKAGLRPPGRHMGAGGGVSLEWHCQALHLDCQLSGSCCWDVNWGEAPPTQRVASVPACRCPEGVSSMMESVHRS